MKKIIIYLLFILFNLNNFALAGTNINDVINFKQEGVVLDSARLKALREVGLTVGAQGGYNQRAKELSDFYCFNQGELCSQQSLVRAHSMDSIFPFFPLIDAGGFLPPVISEIANSISVTDTRMITTGMSFKIEKPARFILTPLTWRDYLTTGLINLTIENVPRGLKPKNDKERKVWEDSVKDGWLIGIKNADAAMQANIDRLKNDYLGMLKFKKLVKLGMIKKPTLSVDTRAQVLTGNELVKNHTQSEIVIPAQMESDVAQWQTGMVIEIPSVSSVPVTYSEPVRNLKKLR